MTTHTDLDESASVIRPFALALFLIVAVGIAVSYRPEPVGVAIQLFALTVLGLAWLMAFRTHWSFAAMVLIAVFANGIAWFATHSASSNLNATIVVLGLVSAYASWRHRDQWFANDDVDLVQKTAPSDKPTVQLAPGLDPSRVQEILQVREDLMNFAGLFIGQDIGTIAMSYDQQLEYALKKDATGLDELLVSAREFLNEHDEAVDALHQPPE